VRVADIISVIFPLTFILSPLGRGNGEVLFAGQMEPAGRVELPTY
jgi:hypothetical protein